MQHATKMILPAIMAAAAVAAAAQPPTPTFSMAISAPDTVKLGAKLSVNLALKNESGQPIYFLRSPAHGEAELYTDLGMRDEKGVPVPEGRYYRALKGHPEEQRKAKKPGFDPPIAVGGSRYREVIPPGETWNDSIVVTGLLELTNLGKYTITLSRYDPESKTVVKSNTVTVTVVR
jgi:hypothetical protein